MGYFELAAVTVLIVLAFGNLFVGVVNDAVNFLSSAIGAKVSSRFWILFFAGVGIMIGTTFSDGILEVARKGIFHPEFFGAGEVIILFTAVALADIILLDLFSTFGLPTSTTVSIVFELFGAALVLGFWKLGGIAGAMEVINSASALKIIIGILLSIVIAFFAGLIIQFFSRMIFTFDYRERFKKWGAIWSAVALTVLLFFILVKGGKHATFITPDMKEWIGGNTQIILAGLFGFFLVLSYVLIKMRVKLLKWIVLIGTLSLAMAFAGNDLANFIGVSVAGTHAYLGAELTSVLPTPIWVFLIAGVTMIVALSVSTKAKTVTGTTLALCSHEKDVTKQWKSNGYMKKMTDMVHYIYSGFVSIIPDVFKNWISKRWTRDKNEKGPTFDKIRAAVNLMVAAAVISYATSQKLPLSTTYVTFMVAMGTALADHTWNKDCAPARLMGVVTVVGGWFFTGIMAIVMSGIIVTILYFTRGYGLGLMSLVVIAVIYSLSKIHKKRNNEIIV